MDVKKSIKDAGYIAVGAGVIGFQQAQVRRHEITGEVTRIARDAGTCVQGRVSSVGSQVVTTTTQARSSVENQATVAWDTASAGVLDAANGLTDRANGIADDVRDLVEPVVGEALVRVEPLVEQLQALPVQVVRAVDAGRTKVLGLVGSGTSANAA
jgi:hypothetical protein